MPARPAMESNSFTEQFELRIPSDTAQGQAVQERIVQRLEALAYSPREVFSVRLALEEALVNAIKHGNGMDPEKNVRIDCRISEERVRIEIEDEGEGFVPEEVPDPTEEWALERPCGRGLMLMRSFMTTVGYNASGNCVVMEKVRGIENSRSDD